MLRLITLGHELRDRGLIHTAFGKRHRKRADRRATVSCHQCYQQGRIDPSRQKRANRDVADHLTLDSAVEQLLQFVFTWDGGGRVHHRRAPVPFDRWLSVAEAPLESAT